MANSNGTSKAAVDVVVIGCGQIGSLWDENREQDDICSSPRTHCGAYFFEPKASLKAVCDVDTERAKTAGQKFKAQPFSNVSTCLKEIRPQVVSLCTPLIHRLSTIETLLKAGVSGIFCEKPVAGSLDEAKKISDLVAAHDVALSVAYLRRWAPGLTALKRKIGSGQFGEFLSGHALYGKGLSNNGSHLVDLVQFLIGAPKSVEAKACIDDDRPSSDQTLSFVMQFEAGQDLVVEAVDHRKYSVFEMDLVFESSRVRIFDRGYKIQYFGITTDLSLPGYNFLTEGLIEATGLEMSLKLAVHELINSTRNRGQATSCSMVDALLVAQTIEAIRESWTDRTRKIISEI